MNHAYNSDATSKAYREFLASENGKIFREIVGNTVLSSINPSVSTTSSHPPLKIERKPGNTPEVSPPFHGWVPREAGDDGYLRILDAGCGDGWLAGLLAQGSARHPEASNFGEAEGSQTQTDSSPKAAQHDNQWLKIYACDAGEPLIKSAQSNYPKVVFAVCDLNKPLPYQDNFFNIVTASMVLHDVEDEAATLQNIVKVLKPGGRLIATIVNPYYGYPIGEWKRGLWGRLLQKTPHLRLARFYNTLMKQERPNFEWQPGLGSHFTPLSHHIRSAAQAGLVLTDLVDIASKTDSPTYNLTYQLHRFPIILLLEFTKQQI